MPQPRQEYSVQISMPSLGYRSYFGVREDIRSIPRRLFTQAILYGKRLLFVHKGETRQKEPNGALDSGLLLSFNLNVCMRYGKVLCPVTMQIWPKRVYKMPNTTSNFRIKKLDELWQAAHSHTREYELDYCEVVELPSLQLQMQPPPFANSRVRSCESTNFCCKMTSGCRGKSH